MCRKRKGGRDMQASDWITLALALVGFAVTFGAWAVRTHGRLREAEIRLEAAEKSIDNLLKGEMKIRDSLAGINVVLAEIKGELKSVASRLDSLLKERE